ncbi:hypothetical protein [Candidatus Lokiarchaeum ossiferum]
MMVNDRCEDFKKLGGFNLGIPIFNSKKTQIIDVVITKQSWIFIFVVFLDSWFIFVYKKNAFEDEKNMRRLVWGTVIGAMIGLLILAVTNNPFVIVGYFGLYLLAVVTIFQHFYEKIRTTEILQTTEQSSLNEN